MSTAYEITRAKADSEMAHGIKFIFPAFDAKAELILRYGNREFEVDGEKYTRALTDIPSVIEQRGAAQDTADFSLNDIEGEIYSLIKPYEDVIEDTQVIIKECLYTDNDMFESEILQNGYIEHISISESSNQINLSTISDMSRTGVLVGGRIVTQRYCGAVFTYGRPIDTKFDACGWIIELGGNPNFCSHKLEGLDGCHDHGNTPRYLAIEALSTAPVSYGNTGWVYSGGGSGGGGGSGPCFTPMTPVWTVNDGIKPICEINPGDFVWGWDKEGNVQPGEVLFNFTHLVSRYSDFDFGMGRNIGATENHLFNVKNPVSYQCIGSIEIGQPLRRWTGKNNRGQWQDTIFLGTEIINKRIRVHNIYVKTLNNYFIVAGDIKIAVSNSKPFQNDGLDGILVV